MLAVSHVPVRRSPGCLVSRVLAGVLRGGSGRSVGGWGGHVGKERGVSGLGLLGRGLDEVQAVLADSVGEVVLEVIAAMLLRHSLVGYHIVVELAASVFMDSSITGHMTLTIVVVNSFHALRYYITHPQPHHRELAVHLAGLLVCK